MNILLNFYPVRAGGGQQVASNFLKIIAKKSFNHRWFVFVGSRSELCKLAKENLPESQILSLEYNYQNRIFKQKEVKEFIRTKQIDLIYSYGPILPVKDIPQVLRTVYSNLYFPEIDFWEGYSPVTKLKKKIIDKFRLKQTLKADGLMFENKSMLERSSSLFKYPEKRVKYIEPSVTFFDESNMAEKYELLKKIKEFKILYLSSWHLNKNIHVLPEVAKNLKENNYKVKFILSLDVNHPKIERLLLSKIEEFKVNEYFEFIGRVEAANVHQVVKSSDAMILLSKLECFSSNVMEAYYFKKPLIISDESWAKSACLNAALYVDRDDAVMIANQIQKLATNIEVQKKLIAASNNRMKSFNQPEEKVKKQVVFLEDIYNQYEKSN